MRSPLLPAAGLSLAALLGFAVASPLSAAPVLVMDVTSGAVLYQQDATQPWYPASLTKLMTVYVALKAVHEGRLTLDTPLVVSPYANSMSPSKMGFRPGTEVTLDNALKMLMVKSANDLAVTIAEGVSGSVEAFADEMNEAAASIGMRESRFFNPNGLPDSRQVTSARDMALLGRALYLQFPEHADLFNIFAFRLGSRMSRNHNPLLGFYPGVDGMKTGFTCSAGFNIVATALRGNRRLITVVMGAPSSGARTAMATALFDRGFASPGSMGPVTSLSASALSEPADMHGKACYGRGRATREFMADVQRVRVSVAPSAPQQAEVAPERGSLVERAKKKGRAAMKVVADGASAAYNVVAVYVGRAPGWSGPVANARPANTPVGTPPPVTAFAPETKPAVLDGSAAPIAASAADALPMRRAAQPAAKPAKTVASREDDDSAADAAPKAKAAKHAKVAHHRHAKTAEGRHRGKHKQIAAAKPLAEGDGAGKPVKAAAHPGRRPEGE
ncbi:MAG: D-alanyl-D-alanine carboxypeptidase [Methylobacteriaceae bacterium]|nr:D-alanyl-D-alanine carboxypeptidase [Methylobacteriaceae bacterium]